MSWSLYLIGVTAGVMIGLLGYIRYLKAVIERKTAVINEATAKIKQINQELRYANQRKTIDEANRRLNDSGVDAKLQQQGDYRD